MRKVKQDTEYGIERYENNSIQGTSAKANPVWIKSLYPSLDWIWTPDPVDFQNVTGTSLSEDI